VKVFLRVAVRAYGWWRWCGREGKKEEVGS